MYCGVDLLFLWIVTFVTTKGGQLALNGDCLNTYYKGNLKVAGWIGRWLGIRRRQRQMKRSGYV